MQKTGQWRSGERCAPLKVCHLGEVPRYPEGSIGAIIEPMDQRSSTTAWRQNLPSTRPGLLSEVSTWHGLDLADAPCLFWWLSEF